MPPPPKPVPSPPKPAFGAGAGVPKPPIVFGAAAAGCPPNPPNDGAVDVVAAPKPKAGADVAGGCPKPPVHTKIRHNKFVCHRKRTIDKYRSQVNAAHHLLNQMQTAVRTQIALLEHPQMLALLLLVHQMKNCRSHQLQLELIREKYFMNFGANTNSNLTYNIQYIRLAGVLVPRALVFVKLNAMVWLVEHLGTLG